MGKNIIFTTSSIIFTTTSMTTVSYTTGSSIASGHPRFAGANPANMVSMSRGLPTESVTFITASFKSMSVQNSIEFFGNTTTTGSFRMPVPISESTSNFRTAFTNSRFTRTEADGSQSSAVASHTSSLEMGFTQGGEWRIHKPTEKGQVGQTEKTFMFVSRSGRIGFKTTNPKDDIDFKADSIKFRSDDGSKELEFTDGKFVTKKFANRAVGAAVVTETSGSEVVLTYSPGTFDSPSTASVNDVLGSLVWEDESLRKRVDVDVAREQAIAMRIRGVVDGVATDGSSIKATMRFGIGGIESAVVSEDLQLALGHLMVTNSAVLTIDNSYLGIGNTRANPGNADRRIIFWNNSTGKRWIAGVDENQSVFAIHQGTSFTTNNDFEIASNGNIFSQGKLYNTGIPTFTASAALAANKFFTGSSLTLNSMFTGSPALSANKFFTGSSLTLNSAFTGSPALSANKFFTGSNLQIDGGDFGPGLFGI